MNRKWLRSKRLVALVLLVALGLGFAVWQSTAPTDGPIYQRKELFGGHYALVRVDKSRSATMFLLPGQSGDRPGHVGIYTAEGAFCGAARVPMVGNFTLDWAPETGHVYLGRPRRAGWDLASCKIRFRNLYPD